MFFVAVLVLGLLGAVRGDCGCLKCSKGLTVISPPSSPLKVILRGKLPQKFPGIRPEALLNYYNQYALTPRLPFYPPAAQSAIYGAQVQIPYIPPPPVPLITSLAPTPDRIVLPAPEAVAPPPFAYPFTSSGPVMETVAIPPPCDSRPMMSVQEVPFYPYQQQYCACQRYEDLLVDYVLSPKPLETKVRTKRGLYPRPYRRPLHHHHTPLGLLTSPLHFFLQTIPKLLAFPVMQFLRMLTGHHHPSLLKSSYPHYYGRPTRRDFLQSRHDFPRRPDFLESRGRFKPTPRSVLLSKLKKINELSGDVVRKRRSLSFSTDGDSVPFYKVSEVEVEGDEDEDEETVGAEFLKPLHFKQLIPHNPLFYLLNTPIRILSHLEGLKKQIAPVVRSIPQVLQNSKRYLMDFGRQFQNHFLDFTSNLVGDFDHAPHFRPLRPLVPKRRYRRSPWNSGSSFAKFMQATTNRSDDSFEQGYSLEHDPLTLEKGLNGTKSRRRRFILKMVDESEVEQFLKEKLGEDAPTVAATLPPKPKVKEQKTRKKLVIEPLSPKIIIDKKGKAFVEMDGMKRPFLSSLAAKFKQRHQKGGEEEEDINKKIASLIEQVKASPQIVGSAPYDSGMYLQIVKEKITQTLQDIEALINADFEKYTNLYEDLAKLQNLKGVAIDEWKQLLVTNRINDMDGKIRILNAFQQLQTNRANILKRVAEILKDERSFMASRLIKMLVRLQKLQCVVYSVVEDFGERLRTRTFFDPQREIRYVEYLDAINFVTAKTREEVENHLRKERDAELEKRIALLERLRELLEQEDVAKINEEARLLWEMKNVEKLQQDSIRELNLKIERGQKVRKELKILFDLQKQLDVAEKKQEEILKEEQIVGMGKKLLKKEKRTLGTTSRYKNKAESVRITPLARGSTLLSNVILKDKKPVKVVTNGYTVVGYITNKHKHK